MKRAVYLIIALTVLIPAIMSLTAFRSTDSERKKRADISGTWQLDSYKYGPSDTFVPVPDARKHLKLITEGKFLWVQIEVATKKILSSSGGSYTLEGDIYTESIDYGYNMDSYLGTMSRFRLKTEDDILFISGELSTGLHIEEIWKKVK